MHTTPPLRCRHSISQVRKLRLAVGAGLPSAPGATGLPVVDPEKPLALSYWSGSACRSRGAPSLLPFPWAPRGDAVETLIVRKASPRPSLPWRGGKTLLSLSGFVGCFSTCASSRYCRRDLAAAEHRPWPGEPLWPGAANKPEISGPGAAAPTVHAAAGKLCFHRQKRGPAILVLSPKQRCFDIPGLNWRAWPRRQVPAAWPGWVLVQPSWGAQLWLLPPAIN